MKALSILLIPRMLSIKNSVTPASLLRRAPFAMIGIAMWLMLYFGVINLLKLLREIGFLGDMIAMKFLSMVFFSLAGFLFLSNIITAVSAFYMSKDLPLLLSKPVSGESLRGYKTIETIIASSWMVVIFIPPVLIACGVGYGASWKYYAAVSLVLLPMVLIPAGAGITAAHLLTRFFPARRTRNILLGMGLLFFLLIYFVLKSAASGETDTIEGLANALLLIRTNSPILPGFWMTETVTPFLTGRTPDLLFPFLLVTGSAFSLLVAGFTGKRLYIGNIFRTDDAAPKAKLKNISAYPRSRWAVCWKDMKIFSRDTEQWSQLVIIGALLMVYVFNFKALPLSSLSGITPYLREIIAVLNIVLAGLVLTAVSARFLYVAVSLEGQAFWLPKSSPLTMSGFLRNKYMFGFIPITVIMLLLVLITNIMLGLGVFLTIISLVTVLMLCFSISGLATGLGAMNPRFEYENIASVSMGPGSVIFMLIAFCLVIVTVSLEWWALYHYKRAALSGLPLHLPDLVRISASVAAAIALNGLAFYLPLKAGIKKLEGDVG